MRRILSLAAFLSISLLLVCAQRGGHAGGALAGRSGGHFAAGGAGFTGHPSGGFDGSHVGAPPGSHVSVISGSRMAGSRGGLGFYSSRGLHFGGRDGFRRNAREFNHRRHCYGCRGYGSPLYGFYDPYWDYWWWDSHSSFDEDEARDRELAREMNEENLHQQAMQRERDEDAYARPAAPAPQAREEDQARAEPATILIFRDRHEREVRNYAIVSGTLWNFAGQRTEKIPLADLDLPATEKANDDRGVEFRVPRTGEGQ